MKCDVAVMYCNVMQCSRLRAFFASLPLARASCCAAKTRIISGKPQSYSNQKMALQGQEGKGAKQAALKKRSDSTAAGKRHTVLTPPQITPFHICSQHCITVLLRYISLFQARLSYVLPCNVMRCDVTLCYATPCCAMLCYVLCTPCYIILCALLSDAVPLQCYAIPGKPVSL